ARVPGYASSRETRDEIARVFELWSDCLARFGGPYLFGERFGIADAMYYPMLGRFRTYDVPLDADAAEYARALDQTPAVQALVEAARAAPRLALYDRYVRLLGGDSEAGQPP